MPQLTSSKSYSYETTTTDEYGNSEPSTAVELHCIDSSGNILKKHPIVHSVLWIGVFALIGFVISASLAFALAAPAGVLITRLFNRGQESSMRVNIEPE